MSPERNQYRISFDEIVANAKEITLKDGHHVPILIVEGSKDLLTSQISEMPETHGERMQLMRFLGQAAAKSGMVGNLEQVFFISEGWMSTASQDKPPNIRPSVDPNRKEVLIISGLRVKDSRKNIRLFEMARDQNKQIVSLEQLLPPQEKDGRIEVPLLEAFAQGFKLAYQLRYN